MSKNEKVAEGPEYIEVDLQELLQASKMIDNNVAKEQHEAARQQAMEDFGLVEGKMPTKKQVAELETLRAKVAELEEQLQASTGVNVALQAKVAELETENADFKSRLTPPPAPTDAPTPPPVDPTAPAKPWDTPNQ